MTSGEGSSNIECLAIASYTADAAFKPPLLCIGDLDG